MKDHKPKELTINGVLYAHYIIENRTLYLKTRKNIVPNDKIKSENYFIAIISLIERKEINIVSYLNIK